LTRSPTDLGALQTALAGGGRNDSPGPRYSIGAGWASLPASARARRGQRPARGCDARRTVILRAKRACTSFRLGLASTTSLAPARTRTGERAASEFPDPMARSKLSRSFRGAVATKSRFARQPLEKAVRGRLELSSGTRVCRGRGNHGTARRSRAPVAVQKLSLTGRQGRKEVHATLAEDWTWRLYSFFGGNRPPR